MVMVGEIGGSAEENAADHLVSAGIKKPVFAYKEGVASALITVTRTGPAVPCSVNYATVNGTALAGFEAAFGRFERVVVGDKSVVLLLIKNPAGANEAVRTLQISRACF